MYFFHTTLRCRFGKMTVCRDETRGRDRKKKMKSCFVKYRIMCRAEQNKTKQKKIWFKEKFKLLEKHVVFFFLLLFCS